MLKEKISIGTCYYYFNLCFIWFCKNWKVYFFKKQKLEIISENNREISNLKLEIDNLNSELENSSSTDFIEKVAREELGMVKPREVVYVDKNKDKTSKTEGLK